MNYQQLINQSHPYKEEDFKERCLVKTKSLKGKTLLIEKQTYESYLALKKKLEKEQIEIGLIDAYRTINAQQEIWNWYEREFGLDYTRRYVAIPGTSEHHTGLAIDIGIVVDGKIYDELDGILTQQKKLSAIFSSLKEYGFILRYPLGKENVTGYSYEPWHFRYVGVGFAKELDWMGCTLEEYLHEKK